MDAANHRRQPLRLPAYDYSQPGAYFITICTHQRHCLLGEVVDDRMHLSEAGQVTAQTWQWLSTRHPHVELDLYVIMPNHLHGVVLLHHNAGCTVPRTPDVTRGSGRQKSLGRLIAAFKTVSTQRINALQGTPHAPVWQRDYYEHVIRNDDSLCRIRDYIANNPTSWALDRENPDAVPGPEAPHEIAPPP